jgi:4-diphosphocytidyl-2-C-methyl-D-erythritol kinase
MPTSTGGTEAGQARTLRLFAPAKINLALEVIGRRDDDFHDLDTVMTTLALGDEVRLGPCDGLDVRFSGRHAAGVGADDLCTRAALALARAAGRISNVTIEVTKRIPVAAGLGGGSSDAAAVLRGLNKLWGLDWPLERLTGIAAELGSDVPFFLYGGTARCTGRGEMVEPLRDMRPLQLLLLQPPVPLAANKTALRFGALVATDFSDGRHAQRLAASLARHAPPPSRDLVNTFEAVIERSDPELLMHYVSYRAAGVPQLHLCGAGPTLYVLVSKRAQLAALHRGFEAAGAEVIETATLPRDEATAVTVEQADA